jgi:tetratricopeptide (TPR) repeat protein
LPAVYFAKYFLARVDALSGITSSSEALLACPPGIADGARGFLAEAHLRNGDVERAEQEARAVAKSASVYARVTALSVLGRIALGRADPREAIRLFDEAIADQDGGSIVPFWRSILLLARAEALSADGQEALAKEALESARKRIFSIAGQFEDPSLRDSYLALPVHVETLERAALATPAAGA